MRVDVIPDLCSGSDLAIVNAARRSFGKQFDTFRTDEDGPRTPRGKSDEGLLRELAEQGHFLPFRHPRMSFECDAPIPVARQLGKHQIGLEWSEVSRRYKTKDISFYRIGRNWRSDVKDRKQGSGELLPEDNQTVLEEIERETVSQCIAAYESALFFGASPEQARFLLPQSMEVLWTWTGTLLAFAHVWKLRHHKDTQKETQDFVRQMDPFITKRFPIAWPLLKGNYAGQPVEPTN
jgi:thymidylate synthase (FAD)